MQIPFWNLQEYWQKRVPAAGLAVFRVCYCLVLLWEVIEFWLHRHLIFDPVPYLEIGSPYLQSLLPFWMAAIVLLMAGYFTPVAAISNYACSTLILGSMTDYEYHFDHISQSVNFLLMFAPVSAVWSIDAWRKQRRSTANVPEVTVHPSYYYLFLIVGVGIVYFDSAIWKLYQPTWQQGLGVWRPMSVPSFTWSPTAYFQFLLNQEWFMKLSNHLTLFLELGFLFLVWSRRCRLWILLPVGVILHVGIIIAFPIPRFSLLMLALYTLVVPPELWPHLAKKLGRAISKTKTIIAETVDTTPEVASSGIWNHRYTITAVFWLIFCMCTVQGIIILQDRQRISYRKLTWHHRELINKYFGLSLHNVFTDPHWTNYDHVVALVHAKEDGTFEWLPLTTPNGQMGSLATGRLWAYWGFRANMAEINNPPIENAAKRLTAYWMASQGQPLDNAKFLVPTKATKPYSGWQGNVLSEQMQMPWQVSGVVNWNLNQCTVKLTSLRETQPLSINAAPFIPPLVSPFFENTHQELHLSAQQILIHR